MNHKTMEARDCADNVLGQFPIEIWLMIVNHLKTYNDVKQVGIVLGADAEYFEDYLEGLKYAETLSCIWERGLLTKRDMLNARLVSRAWRTAADNFCRKNHLGTGFRASSMLPFVQIRVPFSIKISKQVHDFVEHGGNPFIGNRLVLELKQRFNIMPFEATKALLENSLCVWEHVHHLQIWGDRWFQEALNIWSGNGGFFNWYKMVVSQMKNLKSIVFGVKLDSVEYIRALGYLSNLDKLEGLAADCMQDNHGMEWFEILEKLSVNLKQLYLILLTNGQSDAIKKLYFPNLEEFQFRSYEFSGQIHEEFDIFLKYERFPRLLRLGIPLSLKKNENFSQSFRQRLIALSLNLLSLERIEIYISKRISLQDVPKKGRKSICGSQTITRLDVVTNTREKKIPVKWAFGLAQFFSSLTIIRVNHVVFFKRENGKWTRDSRW